MYDLAPSTKVSGERGTHSATHCDKCISHVHVRGLFSADNFFTYIYVDRAQRVKKSRMHDLESRNIHAITIVIISYESFSIPCNVHDPVRCNLTV